MPKYFFHLVGHLPAHDLLGHDCANDTEARIRGNFIAHKVGTGKLRWGERAISFRSAMRVIRKLLRSLCPQQRLRPCGQDQRPCLLLPPRRHLRRTFFVGYAHATGPSCSRWMSSSDFSGSRPLMSSVFMAVLESEGLPERSPLRVRGTSALVCQYWESLAIARAVPIVSLASRRARRSSRAYWLSLFSVALALRQIPALGLPAFSQSCNAWSLICSSSA
jgi:hypothetical protein